MFTKIARLSHLDRSRHSSVQSNEECGSDSDVIDYTTALPPPKKRLTDYFQPAK